MTFIRAAALLAIALLLTPAPASAQPRVVKYVDAAEQALPPRPPDQAQIVFLQPSDATIDAQPGARR